MIPCFFFFNDTATTEIYTLSLHDALPICARRRRRARLEGAVVTQVPGGGGGIGDRKSTRLNSSHVRISYAVFCLKKKKDPAKNTSLSDSDRFSMIPTYTRDCVRRC